MGGVSRGLASWLGVELTTVRLIFAVTTLFNGIGLLAYLILWGTLPDKSGSIPARKLGIHVPASRDPVTIAGFAMTVFGSLLLVRQTGLWFPTSYVLPLTAVSVGLAVVWQPRGFTRLNNITIGRYLIGAVLVVIGLQSLFGRGRSFVAARQMFLDQIVVLAGVALLLGPVALKLFRQLRAEEQRRAQSEAKADVASHLHDSVLQSLALIQKRAHSSNDVVMLARRQERELREWLYGKPVQAETSLRGALEQVANELESDHGVPIDIVTVGGDVALVATDRGTYEGLTGLVQAAREAIANAARHSGTAKVAVYVEVEREQVTVFVRDTGRGFDRSLVEATRRGVSESIEGRMRRLGGTVRIRSTKDVGTNVELILPLRAAATAAPILPEPATVRTYSDSLTTESNATESTATESTATESTATNQLGTTHVAH
jgi:signal transduction histidine kinase